MERINARAKAAGLTRKQYVLNRADPEGATPRATTPEGMAKPTVACLHPKEALSVFGWGTICSLDKGGCGTKIR